MKRNYLQEMVELAAEDEQQLAAEMAAQFLKVRHENVFVLKIIKL